MNLQAISRRRLLRHATLASASGALVALTPPPSLRAAEPPQPATPRSDGLNVRDFGAAGDGKQDDTPAFEAALKGRGQVGRQRRPGAAGQLPDPRHARRAGERRARRGSSARRRPGRRPAGSTLLAVAGAGKPRASRSSRCTRTRCFHGLTVFYPEQKQINPPVPYPWTVRGIGDNCSLVDVLLVNPYQAVDFGTHPAGRHCISGLYAQPLYRGLFIDQCFDVGRVRMCTSGRSGAAGKATWASSPASRAWRSSSAAPTGST